MPKIAVVGAGNVGASAALYAAEAELGDVTLIDILEGVAKGKGLDLLVANDVSAPGAGFEHDTNRVVVLDATGNEQDVPLTDKREVARIVFDAVVAHRKGQKPS